MESKIIDSIVQELLAEIKAGWEKRQAEIEANWEQFQAAIQAYWDKQQADWEKKHADLKHEHEHERERERQERQYERQECTQHQHILIQAMTIRFPDAPLNISSDIWKITDTAKLQQLFLEVIKARDIDDFAHVLKTHTKEIAADNQQ